MTVARPDIVVFLAHAFDDAIVRRFLKLKNECSGLCDVVAFVPTGTTVPEVVRPSTHFFDFAALKPMARATIGDKILPGNCHLRAIDFHRRFPRRRHYWFIEYDVVYTGDWANFIECFVEDRCDLLAARVRDLRDDPGWYWRNTFAAAADGLAGVHQVVAFMPIHRISARGLEAVAAKVEAGWVGHFEILVPTAIVDCGLDVADFGGSGAWTPKVRRYRHYVDCQALPYLGTVRPMPWIGSRPIRNRLYHPCKTATPGNRMPSLALMFRQKPFVVLGYALTFAMITALSRVGL